VAGDRWNREDWQEKARGTFQEKNSREAAEHTWNDTVVKPLHSSSYFISPELYAFSHTAKNCRSTECKPQAPRSSTQ